MAQVLEALGVGLLVVVVLFLTYLRQRLISSAPDRAALSEAYWRLSLVTGVVTILIGLVLILVVILSSVVHF
jgi:hypothetical protein